MITKPGGTSNRHKRWDAHPAFRVAGASAAPLTHGLLDGTGDDSIHEPNTGTALRTLDYDTVETHYGIPPVLFGWYPLLQKQRSGYHSTALIY